MRVNIFFLIMYLPQKTDTDITNLAFHLEWLFLIILNL